jgi:hypothetical protein
MFIKFPCVIGKTTEIKNAQIHDAKMIFAPEQSISLILVKTNSTKNINTREIVHSQLVWHVHLTTSQHSKKEAAMESAEDSLERDQGENDKINESEKIILHKESLLYRFQLLWRSG